MNAHHFHQLGLIICGLLMFTQSACAYEVRQLTGDDKTEQTMSTPKESVTDVNTTVVENAQADSAPAAAPAPADPLLAGRAGNSQRSNGQGMYARVTKEYYNQASAVPGKQEKADTLSKFGFRYSPTGNDRIWLEYRLSDKAALRLRGAAHRGVRVLAVFEY